MKATESELELLRWTITGSWFVKSAPVCRNYIVAAPGPANRENINRLVELGLLRRGKLRDSQACYYHCTAKGAKCLGLRLTGKEPKSPEEFDGLPVRVASPKPKMLRTYVFKRQYQSAECCTLEAKSLKEAKRKAAACGKGGLSGYPDGYDVSWFDVDGKSQPLGAWEFEKELK